MKPVIYLSILLVGCSSVKTKMGDKPSSVGITDTNAKIEAILGSAKGSNDKAEKLVRLAIDLAEKK